MDRIIKSAYGDIAISAELADRFLAVPRRKNGRLDKRYKEAREIEEIDRQIMAGAKEVWNQRAHG